jgi:hypothetical protein
MATNFEKLPDYFKEDDGEAVKPLTDDAELVKAGKDNDKIKPAVFALGEKQDKVVDVASAAALTQAKVGQEIVAKKAQADKEQADSSLKADQLLAKLSSVEGKPEVGPDSAVNTSSPSEQPKTEVVEQAEKADAKKDLAEQTGAILSEKADEKGPAA